MSRENIEDCDIGKCIGRGCSNGGCGYVGGSSGDVCPECGGMVLGDREIFEAEKLADTIRGWEEAGL